jgi:hypothetical protein
VCPVLSPARPFSGISYRQDGNGIAVVATLFQDDPLVVGVPNPLAAVSGHLPVAFM